MKVRERRDDIIHEILLFLKKNLDFQFFKTFWLSKLQIFILQIFLLNALLLFSFFFLV
jgi:hypothetical protein